MSEASDFWDEQKKAELHLKKTAGIKLWVNLFAELEQALEDAEVLIEFYKEDDSIETEVAEKITELKRLLEDLELRNMLQSEEDKLDAILTINSGAGGTESTDWVQMLMRMYLMWGEKHKYKIKQINIQEGDVVGIKSVTLSFVGDYAYGYLKSENGIHRLVRLSPFDSSNKRHTTFASVSVIPMIDDSIEIDINPADISWDTFRSSGAGGQGVNKIESGVRLKHKPSGITVDNTESRSQHQNKENAIRILKSHLYEIALRKKQDERQKIEQGKKKIDFGSQIRNYVMHPYKMVKDLRTNIETANVQAVMDGELDEFIKAYLMEF